MSLLTPTFKSMITNDFVSNVDSNEYYVFAGKTLGYSANGVVSASNSVDGYYHEIEKEMIFGKKIGSSDYNLMIKNIAWETDTVYEQYDNTKENLEQSNFYVVAKEGVDYGVFKCLSNNNGNASTVKPLVSETSSTDELYETSDGYIWKYLYSITEAQYKRFATTDYVPFFDNEAVANNAVVGSINSYVLTDAGLGYDSNVSGSIAQINISGLSTKFYIQGDQALTTTVDYYKNNAIYIKSGVGAGQLRKITKYGVEGNFKFITVDSAFDTQLSSGDTFEISPNVVASGDGTGFQARGIVSSNTTFLDSIEIINQGTGYTRSDLSVEINESVVTESVYTKATARAIISPKGGHGSNLQDELFGHYVGFTSFFIESEVPGEGNDFRTVGIIRNPVFNSAIIEIDTVSGINVGNTAIQNSTGATGTVLSINSLDKKITLKDVTGVFSSAADEMIEINSTDYDIISIEKNTNTFDQRLPLTVSFTFGSQFLKDELVVQAGSGAQGYVYNDNGTVFVINTKGTFTISVTDELIGQESGSRALITGVGQKDMIDESEEILYVQNIIPIVRTIDNTERLKII